MTIGLLTRDVVTPVSGSFDFNTAGPLNTVGPYWVSLLAWVSTADVVAGALSFSMSHVDAVGNTVLSPTVSGTLVLSDPTSTFSTAVEMIFRQNGTALWTLDTALGGSAGTSKVSYRVMVYPQDSPEFNPF